MSRPFLHAVLTGLVALVLTSEAYAQTNLPRFDCPALLNDTGLADSTARTRQRLNAAPLTLTWIADEDVAPPPPDAPVTLVPLRAGIAPRLARSEPVPLGDQVMVCTLIGVTARPYIDAETPYMISDLRGAAALPACLCCWSAVTRMSLRQIRPLPNGSSAVSRCRCSSNRPLNAQSPRPRGARNTHC